MRHCYWVLLARNSKSIVKLSLILVAYRPVVPFLFLWFCQSGVDLLYVIFCFGVSRLNLLDFLCDTCFHRFSNFSLRLWLVIFNDKILFTLSIWGLLIVAFGGRASSRADRGLLWALLEVGDGIRYNSSKAFRFCPWMHLIIGHFWIPFNMILRILIWCHIDAIC